MKQIIISAIVLLAMACGDPSLYNGALVINAEHYTYTFADHEGRTITGEGCYYTFRPIDAGRVANWDFTLKDHFRKFQVGDTIYLTK